jgi:hypothetical protein
VQVLLADGDHGVRSEPGGQQVEGGPRRHQHASVEAALLSNMIWSLISILYRSYIW